MVVGATEKYLVCSSYLLDLRLKKLGEGMEEVVVDATEKYWVCLSYLLGVQ